MAEDMNFDILTETELEELKSEYNSKGVTGCLEYFDKKNEEWKTVPLRVGVIGATGAGKSSFINAVRGLLSEDEGAAPVGVVETTKIPIEYPHPNNAMFKFWDLPRVGTPNFPKNSYLEQICVDSYDCFVIMTAGRFTENDVWLAQEIVKQNKNFYFVRTKMISIKNQKRSKYRHKKSGMQRKIFSTDDTLSSVIQSINSSSPA